MVRWGPRPFFSAYSASKAGVVRFSENLAGEVAEHGIDVNAIAPGAVNTRMLDQRLAAGAAMSRQRNGSRTSACCARGTLRASERLNWQSIWPRRTQTG